MKKDESAQKRPLKKMRQDRKSEEQEDQLSQASMHEPSEESVSTRRNLNRKDTILMKRLEMHAEEAKRIEGEIKQIIDTRLSSPESSRDGSVANKKALRKKQSIKSPKKK